MFASRLDSSNQKASYNLNESVTAPVEIIHEFCKTIKTSRHFGRASQPSQEVHRRQQNLPPALRSYKLYLREVSQPHQEQGGTLQRPRVTPSPSTVYKSGEVHVCIRITFPQELNVNPPPPLPCTAIFFGI